MITFTRTASIASGKAREAITFAHQIAKLIKEKHGTTLEVLMPVGGNPYRIAWRSRYESLAQWETFSAKVNADADYMATIAENGATFLPGSISDEIWRTL
jgi:hypothetical protein